jgi:hypothetical protein
MNLIVSGKRIDIDACNAFLSSIGKTYLTKSKYFEPPRDEKLVTQYPDLVLYQDWVMPLGETKPNMQLLLKCIWEREDSELCINALYSIMVSLNPEIKAIVFPDNKKQSPFKFDVMFGMVSSFNFDDIQFYITYGGFCYSPMETRERTVAIERKLGFGLQWVLSKETLNKLEEYTKDFVELMTEDKRIHF